MSLAERVDFDFRLLAYFDAGDFSFINIDLDIDRRHVGDGH